MAKVMFRMHPRRVNWIPDQVRDDQSRHCGRDPQSLSRRLAKRNECARTPQTYILTSKNTAECAKRAFLHTFGEIPDQVRDDNEGGRDDNEGGRDDEEGP